MKTFIPPGALCFDIGAHHGESADKLLNHYGAGHVISVEPELQNYLKLQHHWNGDGRVTPIHAAVLDTPGLVRIHRAAAQDGLTTVASDKWSRIYPEADFQAPQLVPVVTLAMLEAEFGTPSYLKVDVEGVELAVLKGLCGRPAFISFEFHGAYLEDALSCLDLLAARGYTLASYVEEDVELDATPSADLKAVRVQLEQHRPNWGNITVR